MISPAESGEGLRAQFALGDGVHHFDMRRGQRVSVVSAPNWEAFIQELEGASDLGEIALSPEQITAADDIESPGSRRSTIERRIKQVKEHSLDRPQTVIVLGSDMSLRQGNGNGSSEPVSSMLFIRRGHLVAHTNRQYEADGAFIHDQARGARSISPYVAGIVGADLIGEAANDGTNPARPRAIPTHAETVLLSSGVSLSVSEEELQARTGRLFEEMPHIQELVVADRVPDMNAGTDVAVNALFTRPPQA